MFKYSALLLGVLALTGCNDDDHDVAPQPSPPKVNVPDILIIGHRGASSYKNINCPFCFIFYFFI